MKALKTSAKNLRRALAVTLACYFAGCAGGAETTKRQFNLIKPDMTRDQVVAILGEPAQTNFANGAPSEDLYSCDGRGQIAVIRDTDLALTNEFLEVRDCVVHYEHGRVASTSKKHGSVVTQ